MSLTTFIWTDMTVHVLLVGFAAVVLAISVLALLERRTRRYVFLCLAFSFLTMSQVVDLIESLYLSSELILIPQTGIHLSHFLNFLMLSSFSIALLAENRRQNWRQQ